MNKTYKGNKEFLDFIFADITKFIKTVLPITNDFIIGIKLVRLSLVIIRECGICFDLIEQWLKYAESENWCWKKILGWEGMSDVFANSNCMYTIFKNHFNIYENWITSLTDITYKNILVKKTQDTAQMKGKKNEKNESAVNPKFRYIDIITIICEGDPINVNVNVTTNNWYKILTECFVNIRDSFISVMEKNKIKINQRNSQWTPEQEEIKQMVNYKYVSIKGAWTGWLINTTDDGVTQTYLNVFQSFISIFASINLPNVRDDFLNDLCKLGIPNNLENTLEMKEKNILIMRTIFNIAHCVNLWDYNSWILLIETIQTLYLMWINSDNYLIRPEDEYDIDIIIKNLEMNIKKYAHDTPTSEIHEIIKETGNKVAKGTQGSVGVGSSNTPSGIASNTSTTPTNAGKKDNNKPIFISPNKKQKTMNNTGTPSGAAGWMSANGTRRQWTQEEIDNMQILSTVVDTLFIDSNTYENTTIIDISKAFHDVAKKIIDGLDKKSDSIYTFLNFNWVKILEWGVINVNKIDWIWNNIIDTVELISSKDIENVSRFSIDIWTVIIIFVLIKYQNVFNEPAESNSAIAKNSNWSKQNWEETLFQPLNSILNNTKYLSGLITTLLNNMSKILQKSGIYLDNSGWTSYIDILKQVLQSTKVDALQTESIFKIIEQIFNVYSTHLTMFNINPLLNILESFSLYKENNNICYSAVALFWSCANITENFQKSKVEWTPSQTELYKEYLPTKQKQDEFFKNEWKEIFSKWTPINDDERFDIRKSGINVFSQIFVEKIDSITTWNVSEEIIKNIFFIVIEKNLNIYENQIDNKEWEETIKISIQAIGKVSKAFLSVDDVNKGVKEGIYNKWIEICLKIIKCSTPDINNSILKIIVEISQADSEWFHANLKWMYEVFTELGTYIKTEVFLKKYSIMTIGGKLWLNMLDTFKQVLFKPKDHSFIIQDKSEMSNFFSLIETMIWSSKGSEGSTSVATPQKLLRNEKDIFDFVDDIARARSSNEVNDFVFSFWIKFITYSNKEPHSEALCRRAVESIGSWFDNINFNYELHYATIMMQIKPWLLIRNNGDTVETLVKFNKDPMQLWHFLSNELLKIISSSFTRNKSNIMNSKITDSNWESTILIFEEIFKQSESGYKGIPRIVQDELIKSCQEMEIQIINYIVDSLIPNSVYIPSHWQTKLLSLLEIGSKLDYSASSYTNSVSISKMCLSNWFDLCRFRSEDSIKKEVCNNSNISEEQIDEYINIKKKIANMCTPILLKRCQDIMRKFWDDEIKSGAMPLSRNRLEEIKFVLEKIKILEVYPSDDSGNESIIQISQKGRKGHLFMLHRILGDFITTKENEIKFIVKDIFKLISNEIEGSG